MKFVLEEMQIDQSLGLTAEDIKKDLKEDIKNDIRDDIRDDIKDVKNNISDDISSIKADIDDIKRDKPRTGGISLLDSYVFDDEPEKEEKHPVKDIEYEAVEKDSSHP